MDDSPARIQRTLDSKLDSVIVVTISGRTGAYCHKGKLVGVEYPYALEIQFRKSEFSSFNKSIPFAGITAGVLSIADEKGTVLYEAKQMPSEYPQFPTPILFSANGRYTPEFLEFRSSLFGKEFADPRQEN
jgi:hypothetical protein